MKTFKEYINESETDLYQVGVEILKAYDEKGIENEQVIKSMQSILYYIVCDGDEELGVEPAEYTWNALKKMYPLG